MFFKKKEAGSDGRLLAVQTGLVVPVSEVDDPVLHNRFWAAALQSARKETRF